MILELDIGNTRCKWRLLASALASSDCGACAVDELRETLARMPGRAAIVRVRAGCVRGESVEDLVRAVVREVLGLGVEFARSQPFAAGVLNGYAEPLRLGVDRWLAILAAHAEVRGPVCVMDCGSAITADLVDGNGHHRGGYISPGLAMMRKSLLVSTDRVRFADAGERAEPSPGIDTGQAVSRGTLLAAAGFLRGARDRFEALCPGAPVLMTGGDAQELGAGMGFVAQIRPLLVLDGLRLALP